MQLIGKPKAFLRSDAKDFINLYELLEERSENFVPRHVFDNLKNFVRLCLEEPDDPSKQHAEIDRYILELKEAIPGYLDVSLMLFPHEDSKAFQFRSKKNEFKQRLTSLIDKEAINHTAKKRAINILNSHDYSVGTPPVNQKNLDYRFKLLLGEKVEELRKFRSVLGINDDVEESQWNYLLDVLDQMVIQSSHYTTAAEKKDFLERTKLTVNFKGLNGFIRTVVGGHADTVVKLLEIEMFGEDVVKVYDFDEPQKLLEEVKKYPANIFVFKVRSLSKNIFNDYNWFPYLSRIILVDDSDESRATNTSLVFAFHNKVINTLNKVHTKKLGTLANSQLNLRLILDKVSTDKLQNFKALIEKQIQVYEQELIDLKQDQLNGSEDSEKELVLFRFNDFAKQILKDKYTLEKLNAYINLILNTTNQKTLAEQNKKLASEFESRTKKYFYSGNEKAQLTTIVEGGGRNQIKTYGEYLRQRKLKKVDPKIIEKCRVILDIIPDNYQRTLKNHFHKNFGVNLFLEKYKEYITKVENSADNRGRFFNFLIDLGIKEKYDQKSEADQKIIKEFISNLANLDKTSISDDVQMIIRDVLFGEADKVLKPYILFNQDASWEYKDLFPVDRFDLNPFDLEIALTNEGRIDYERLHRKLTAMKATFQLFDDSGNLWDNFCENLTIVINDPSNPAGFSDFNNVALIKFLKFLADSKITLFLDEAYNDSVKIDDQDEPKWRIISRYIMNNISAYPNISMVSSLSTTKNLGATGDRLGTLVATPAKQDVIDYARSKNDTSKGNTNSLFMLVNFLESAQLAKKIKDEMEERLPRNASKSKIKSKITNYIKNEIEGYQKKKNKTNNGSYERFSPFEGSPLHLHLLNELSSLDKLDVLDLPDDFKYRGEPFFAYYKKSLIKEINAFRVNKNFRNESNKRLDLAKRVAYAIIELEKAGSHFKVLESDGSYLFNLKVKDFLSYQDFDKFALKLAEQRGIAVLPYKAGFLRFSLGDYLDGTEEGYFIFRKEFENALKVVIKYWKKFYEARTDIKNKNKSADEILDSIFKTNSDRQFIQEVLNDFQDIYDLNIKTNPSLKISNIDTLYLPSPKESGVSINTISDSNNSIFEFGEQIGHCNNVIEFIQSKAFTKIFENLIPQIHKRIPLIKHLDIPTVLAKYGKSTLLKYVNSKLDFQPTHYVLDNPDELSIMTEILIELERILFSDAKTKILALDASENSSADRARLEGVNRILRKHIQELLLHFNIPFEQDNIEPTYKQLFDVTIDKFQDIIGKTVDEFGFRTYADSYIHELRNNEDFKSFRTYKKAIGYLFETINTRLIDASIGVNDKVLYLYLLKKDNNLINKIIRKFENLDGKLTAIGDEELEFLTEDFIFKILPAEFDMLFSEIYAESNIKVAHDMLQIVSRKVVLFFIDVMNRTKATEYYDKYTHTLLKMVKTQFRKQNSRTNEMVQHGITLHRKFEMKNGLDEYENGSLKWINELMKKCGVVAAEQPVQTHTRIVTDAKKREFPFHRIDRTEALLPKDTSAKKTISPNEYIKNLDTKPKSMFFNERMSRFIENIDPDDYRCKIVKSGLLKELIIFQKSYTKYMTDNFRLLDYEEVTKTDLENFIPDVVQFLGAPEKVISFPQVGYFDLPGPLGKITTIVTPLNKKGDYFGNVKKPRLTILNEKIKEIGGIPIHGSLFAVEEEDGAVFVVQVDGDSGVGKSEMLAAMMLKWLKKDLPGIRSLKLIAGDMFHVFPDKHGNLYGIGTEVGDFSRVTDFDPDYIKFYYSLFESSADSNVEDRNARSTIGGLCDVSMPYKIDIMLTASNYAREEAGITRYENPENFILYRDSHGERKEKATSGDNPHFQRSLMRYSGDRNIFEILDKHGNTLDDALDWENVESENKFYLCSSYKLIDKIDIEDVVNKIFTAKKFKNDGILHQIEKVEFDVIKNRFIASTKILSEIKKEREDIFYEVKTEFLIDRNIFNDIFEALASTPAGQPFISEQGQVDGKHHLIKILKGGKNGKGKGKDVQLGILSTDLGRKGKEITGPQMAAEDMKKLIQEVRISNPEKNQQKNLVRKLTQEKYSHIFGENDYNSEINRYNYYLYQLQEMRKADFRRIDNLDQKVDLNKIKGFKPLPEDHVFCPLLVTPNINMELKSFTETYEQLMCLPHIKEFAEEFYSISDQLYIAEGYSDETIANNMIMQLLLMNKYIANEDLTRGRITEKINRETLAAAKWAVSKRIKDTQKVTTVPKPPAKKRGSASKDK